MKKRPEYNKKLIGENLRRCRQAKHFSVEQVREYLRLGSVQAIYKWEEGAGYPQTDTMFALMELYGIELRDLLYEGKTEEAQAESGDVCEASPKLQRFKGKDIRHPLFYPCRFAVRMVIYIIQTNEVYMNSSARSDSCLADHVDIHAMEPGGFYYDIRRCKRYFEYFNGRAA